jgi:N-acetylneuraminate synthase/N,N'-diacetyllegionaminate synthase
MTIHIGSWHPGDRTLVVAEIGNNHNGDFDTAVALVHQAAASGADAVKFQCYHGERLVRPEALTFGHVAGGPHRTQLERFKSLEFTPAQWSQLAECAAQQRVGFFASVFDEAAADLLAPLVPAYKIASGDVTNTPLLRHVARLGKPVILSTGMATVEEIERALADLAGCAVILFHCVSRYPTPIEAANLRSIPFLRSRFGVPVGYSDHTLGMTACLGAVALGAVALEKHFTLDATQQVGDHHLSATPEELRHLVTRVRELEAALGVDDKQPDATEQQMRARLRRSLHAHHPIAKGAVLNEQDFIALRPGTGLAPTMIDQLTGRRATRPIAEGSVVQDADCV